jgi:DNA-binding MarR family transcriptional regulator
MPGIAADRSAFVLITAVERQLSAAVAADLELEGVTIEQWRVLDELSQREGLSMSEIANRARLPAPTLTKIVDRLVAENLVHRRSDPYDRRRVLVLLTARGRAVRSRLDHVVQQHQSGLESVLGHSGLEQLTDLLARLKASDWTAAGAPPHLLAEGGAPDEPPGISRWPTADAPAVAGSPIVERP